MCVSGSVRKLRFCSSLLSTGYCSRANRQLVVSIISLVVDLADLVDLEDLANPHLPIWNVHLKPMSSAKDSMVMRFKFSIDSQEPDACVILTFFDGPAA